MNAVPLLNPRDYQPDKIIGRGCSKVAWTVKGNPDVVLKVPGAEHDPAIPPGSIYNQIESEIEAYQNADRTGLARITRVVGRLPNGSYVARRAVTCFEAGKVCGISDPLGRIDEALRRWRKDGCNPAGNDGHSGNLGFIRHGKGWRVVALDYGIKGSSTQKKAGA